MTVGSGKDMAAKPGPLEQSSHSWCSKEQHSLNHKKAWIVASLRHIECFLHSSAQHMAHQLLIKYLEEEVPLVLLQ